MIVQRAVRTSSSALTQVAVSQHDGSVMETMIVETCLMNRTAAVSLYVTHVHLIIIMQ